MTLPASRAGGQYKVKRMEQTEARFWAKVFKTPNCWFWLGALDTSGYGIVTVNGRHRMATHLSWFIAKGEWPKEQLLHDCDIRQCIRPSHLFEGTNLENIRDAVRKGSHESSWRAEQIHCKYGHEFSKENTAVRSGRRCCKACERLYRQIHRTERNEYHRQWRQKKKNEKATL